MTCCSQQGFSEDIFKNELVADNGVSVVVLHIEYCLL